MKVMMMTATLIEPVPRSILLACLTNNLPNGVSLTALDLSEKDKPKRMASPVKSKVSKKKGYQKPQEESVAQEAASPDEPEVNLEIKGLAPSDIEVASYIANLSDSILLDQVQLVQSEERDVEGTKFREFRLKARIRPNLKLTRKDIEAIRDKRNETI